MMVKSMQVSNTASTPSRVIVAAAAVPPSIPDSFGDRGQMNDFARNYKLNKATSLENSAVATTSDSATTTSTLAAAAVITPGAAPPQRQFLLHPKMSTSTSTAASSLLLNLSSSQPPPPSRQQQPPSRVVKVSSSANEQEESHSDDDDDDQEVEFFSLLRPLQQRERQGLTSPRLRAPPPLPTLFPQDVNPNHDHHQLTQNMHQRLRSPPCMFLQYRPCSSLPRELTDIF